jgi:hypothetical protein
MASCNMSINNVFEDRYINGRLTDNMNFEDVYVCH